MEESQDSEQNFVKSALAPRGDTPITTSYTNDPARICSTTGRSGIHHGVLNAHGVIRAMRTQLKAKRPSSACVRQPHSEQQS